MTYLDHVTTYYLNLVGRGISLSSQDIQRLQCWQAWGLTPATVCRTLGKEYEKRGRPRRFSIADCDDAMERLVEQVPQREEGAKSPEKWTPDLLLERLEKAGTATEDRLLKETYRGLYMLVSKMPQGEFTVEQVSRLDSLAVKQLESHLEKNEKSRVRRVARQRAKKLLGDGKPRIPQSMLAKSLLEKTYCENFGLLLPSYLLSGDTS